MGTATPSVRRVFRPPNRRRMCFPEARALLTPASRARASADHVCARAAHPRTRSASVREAERPRRTHRRRLADGRQLVVGGLGAEHCQDAVIVDLEDVRRQGLARARAHAEVPVHLDPAHRDPASLAGSRLMPLTNDERSRSGSPATSRSGNSSKSFWNVTAISRLARWAPRQKCGPWPPKPTCGFGSRARSNTWGSGKTAGSRLAAA